VVTLIFVTLVGVLVVSALDHRFMWSAVPTFVSILGSVLVALGLYIDVLVLKENSFGASSVRIMEGQQVVTTGPYAIVRHPMYAGALIMVIGMPLALGSWWGLLLVLPALGVLVARILDEEKMLEQGLSGYTDYERHVPYRLVPSVW